MNLSMTMALRMTRQILLQHIRPSTCIYSKRHLFNSRLLGLDDYQNHQKKFKKKLEFSQESFFNKTTRKDGRNIQYYDLFRMLHLAETDSDIEHCIDMSKRYLNLKMTLNESDLALGPLIMRMLHNLKRPDVAMKVVKDKDLADMFGHNPTSLIYMDLLYESEKYLKLVEFFFQEVHKENGRKSEQLIDSNHTALCMAALYKINTKESLEMAVDYLFKQYHQEQTVLSHRTKAFAAVLAANQNEHGLALEIIDMEYESTFVGNLNTVLRMQFLARLNRLNEALWILEDFLYCRKEAKTVKGFARVFPDCVEVVKESVEKCDDLELKETFYEIEEQLISQGLIHSKTSIDMLNTIILNSRKDTAKLRGVTKKSISRR